MWKIYHNLPDEIIIYRHSETEGDFEFVVAWKRNDNTWNVGNFVLDSELALDSDKVNEEIDLEDWGPNYTAEELITEAVRIDYKYFVGEDYMNYPFEVLAAKEIENYTGLDLSEHYKVVYITDYRDWLISEYCFDNHVSVDLLDSIIEYCQQYNYSGSQADFELLIGNILDKEDRRALDELDLIF